MSGKHVRLIRGFVYGVSVLADVIDWHVIRYVDLLGVRPKMTVRTRPCL